ncbi:MAG: HAD family hydrolase [Patescibacteria group bacterium]
MKIVIFDLDDTLFDTSGQLDETYSGLNEIKLFPETLSVLKTLKAKGIILFLVSIGSEKIQTEKIKILKINDYFEEIFICSTGEEKYKIFEKIINDYIEIETKEILVAGDRIDREITYGKQLGCFTVRINRGKWKDLQPANKLQVPDYIVNDLTEILEII